MTLAYWAITLLFVIALILGLALVVKKFAMPNSGRSTLFRKSSDRRLEVLDILAIDHKTRLVLLRRDDVNHLIMMGANGDLIIESGIKHLPKKSADTLKQTKTIHGGDISSSGGDGGGE